MIIYDIFDKFYYLLLDLLIFYENTFIIFYIDNIANIKHSGMPESNQLPLELQSIALPNELIPDPNNLFKKSLNY